MGQDVDKGGVRNGFIDNVIDESTRWNIDFDIGIHPSVNDPGDIARIKDIINDVRAVVFDGKSSWMAPHDVLDMYSFSCDRVSQFRLHWSNFRLTKDKTRLMVDVDYHSDVRSDVSFVVPIIQKGRWDILETLHFTFHALTQQYSYAFDLPNYATQLGTMTRTHTEKIAVSFSLTNFKAGDGNFKVIRLVELAKLLHIIFACCDDNHIIEWLSRYETPDLKWYFRDHFDEYGINRCKDRPELRMFLMRYVQGAPEIETETKLNPDEAYRGWRL